MVTIQLIPVPVALVGWPLAFPALTLGPAAGIALIRCLGLGSLQPLAHECASCLLKIPLASACLL